MTDAVELSVVEEARQLAADADRVVVKAGTNSLTDDESNLDDEKLDKLVDDVVDLLEREKEVVLVSSGAVGAGKGRVGYTDETVEESQALSTVGQSHLMRRYTESFERYDRKVAQILLTQNDLDNPDRFTNFKNTIETLLEWDIVPIINENDAVATEEIRIGDNDMLSSSVAVGVDSELLVTLTDVGGVYTGNPKEDPDAERIEAVGRNYADVQEIVDGSASATFGGIQTKVAGARSVSEHGIPAVIAKSTEDVLEKSLVGRRSGPYSFQRTVSSMTEKSTETKVEEAQAAALELAKYSDDRRSEALHAIADAIDESHDEILEANEVDVREGEKLLEAGEYSQALVDRLKLSPAKLESITEMVRSVAGQDDPLGRTRTARKLDDGLELYEQTVPIGVVGTIFESRPDALVQIAALSLKSGNAAILKGGSEASESNRVLYEIIREATADAPDGWAQLIEARADVDTILKMDDAIDLVMPAGVPSSSPTSRTTRASPSSATPRASVTSTSTARPTSAWPRRSPTTRRCSIPRSVTPSRRCSSTRTSPSSCPRSPSATPRRTSRSVATRLRDRSSTSEPPRTRTGRPSTAT